MENVIDLDERRKTQAEHLARIENDLVQSLAFYISENDETQQGLDFELIYELIKDMTVEDLIDMYGKEVDKEAQSWQLFNEFYELPEGLQYKLFWSVKANIILNLTEPELDL